MKLAELILHLIKKQNTHHIFGVPGDYNLHFLDFIEDDPDIQWIGNCNELNGAYAADGYARENGFGVLITTHGVGELSVVNGIAGSYAENAPILHIVGYPSTDILDGEIPVHHTLAHGDKTNFLHCFNGVSCENVLLSKANCVEKLLSVFSEIIRTKTPGVIGLPCDLLNVEVDLDMNKVDILSLKPDSSLVPDACLEKIGTLFNKAQRAVFLLGSDIHNFDWTEQVQKLVDRLGIPFATLFMGKGVLNEEDKHYIGMYAGDLSYPKDVQKYVENSDCIISIGTRRTDFTTGGFTDKHLEKDNNLIIKPHVVHLGKHAYKNLHIPSLLEALTEKLSPKQYTQVVKQEPKPSDVTKWDQSHFWGYIAREFLKAGDIVAPEVGTSLFGLLWEKIPSQVTIVSQVLWASIGFSLPAIFGSVIASPKRRGVLIIGDGSFLLTAQEVSSMVRFNTNIIILLINNEGYTIERAIHGAEQAYNDIAKWDFIKFAQSVGVKHTAQAKSYAEFESAMSILNEDGPKFIECFFEKQDVPTLLSKVADILEKQDN